MLYQDALAPIRGQLPGDVATGAQQSIQSARRSAANITILLIPYGPGPDCRGQFIADVNNIQNDVAQNAPGALQQFNEILIIQVRQKLSAGNVMTGNQWGDTRSYLNTVARNNRLGNTT